MNTICPYCNYFANMHETLKNDVKNPKDGDYSFCINCGEWSEYKDRKLIKYNITLLDKETKNEMKEIEIAWLKSRELYRKSKEKHGSN